MKTALKTIELWIVSTLTLKLHALPETKAYRNGNICSLKRSVTL